MTEVPILDKTSELKIEQFIAAQQEVKEADHASVTDLIVKGVTLMNDIYSRTGKKLTGQQKKDLLKNILHRIGADEATPFDDDLSFDKSIDTIVGLATGKIKITPKKVFFCCISSAAKVVEQTL